MDKNLTNKLHLALLSSACKGGYNAQQNFIDEAACKQAQRAAKTWPSFSSSRSFRFRAVQQLGYTMQSVRHDSCARFEVFLCARRIVLSLGAPSSISLLRESTRSMGLDFEPLTSGPSARCRYIVHQTSTGRYRTTNTFGLGTSAPAHLIAVKFSDVCPPAPYRCTFLGIEAIAPCRVRVLRL